ncbi:hypothetical protein ACSX1A_15425 [Pontibacter sp. MBLB2868]|uniref:hypothetical protein n=1 Tax=Pontibacter sp. MBLB2868 TaxID=3451555 RepID=UPI003F74B825
MENNQNNKNSQPQSNTNLNPQSSSSSTSNQSSNMQSSSSKSSNMQGRSNQQGTTGQGGLKNIQDKLQQFGSATAQKVSNLSTTQKVVGGSLLALGAGWLALGSKNKNKIKNQAGSLASSAKDKIKSEKHSRKFGNSGSSSIDARVK